MRLEQNTNIYKLAGRFRKAIRRQGGIKLSNDDLCLLSKLDIVDRIYLAEAHKEKEILEARKAKTKLRSHQKNLTSDEMPKNVNLSRFGVIID